MFVVNRANKDVEYHKFDALYALLERIVDEAFAVNESIAFEFSQHALNHNKTSRVVLFFKENSQFILSLKSYLLSNTATKAVYCSTKSRVLNKQSRKNLLFKLHNYFLGNLLYVNASKLK